MKNATWPREDYRELLELVVIFLGGVAKRVRSNDVADVDISIRKPGAIHRARFMASCLYLLKICLYSKQFKSLQKNSERIADIRRVYCSPSCSLFLESATACAPRNDRGFLGQSH